MKHNAQDYQNNTSIKTNRSEASITCVMSISLLSYLTDMAEMKTALAFSLSSYILISLYANMINKQYNQTNTTPTRLHSSRFFNDDIEESLFTNANPANN